MEPDVLVLVADPEALDGHDPGGVGRLVLDAGTDLLGRPSRGGVRRRAPLGLDVGRATDPRLTEGLIRLDQDPEGPFLAPRIWMIPLGLGVVGVAQLLQAGV